MQQTPKNWLALGDSYTVGEGVPLYESYPYQTLQRLRARGMAFQAPEIIARTAWTSHELIAQLERTTLLPVYDYVSLLIGVNNQYRGMEEDGYESTFEWLADKALTLTEGLIDRIIVISIPDWGVTPFAGDRNAAEIAAAIDRHNAINRRISEQKGFHYLDITPHYRQTGGLPENVVEDQLHPSGKIYENWAENLDRFFR